MYQDNDDSWLLRIRNYSYCFVSSLKYSPYLSAWNRCEMDVGIRVRKQ